MIQGWFGLINTFQDFQKYQQERFSRYRNGDETYARQRGQIRREFLQRQQRAANRPARPWYPRVPNRDGDHELAIQARKVPRVDYPRQSRETLGILNAPLADLNRVVYRPPDGNQPAFNLDWIRREIAEEEVHRVAGLMKVKKEFTFIKVLGAGSNGVVVLWRWNPGGDEATSYDIVMKMSLRMDNQGAVNFDGIENEKIVMLRFLRAPHLAQLFFFRAKLPTPARVPRQTSTLGRAIATADSLDLAEGILPMEFAKMGDLRNWIEKLAGVDNHLPPEALWRIFDCLVKACNAMEYPPIRRAGPGNQRVGPPLLEDIPQGPPGAPTLQPGYSGFVHFDLDPNNIFVIGYDQPGAANPPNPDHTQVPRFQIGDFGLTETGRYLWGPTTPPGAVGPDIWTRRYNVWSQRNMAKHGWFLPEQFSIEWDQLNRGPDDGPPNARPGDWPAWDRWRFPSGPGRYSSLSNIWHIGLNMFCLLLLQRPDFPPVAGRMESAEPPQYNPVPARHQRWTYGYRLIEDSEEGDEYRQRFTPLLCETVARCLMHKQEHRPTLVELQGIITNALGNPPPPLPDDVRNFFGSDVQPPVRWYGQFVDIDLMRLDPFDPYPGFHFLEEVTRDEPQAPAQRRVRGRMAEGDRAYRP